MIYYARCDETVGGNQYLALLRRTDEEAIDFFRQAYGYHLISVHREIHPLVTNGWRQFLQIHPKPGEPEWA